MFIMHISLGNIWQSLAREIRVMCVMSFQWLQPGHLVDSSAKVSQ